MLNCGSDLSSGLDIENLGEKDLPSLSGLFSAVGWGNYTDLDVRLFLHWAGDYALGIRLNDDLVASGMAIVFDNKIARLCCIITHPDFQGQGFASRITRKLIEKLKLNGISCIELDASSQGKPVYERLDFRAVGTANLYYLNNDSTYRSQDIPMCPGAKYIHEIIALDAEAFGIDRTRFILKLAEYHPAGLFVDLSGSRVDGFIHVTMRNQSISIGPWVHRNPEGASKLLCRVLSSYPKQKITVYTPFSNRKAEEILFSFHFSKGMSLTRMVQGERGRVKGNSLLYYGLMSPVVG